VRRLSDSIALENLLIVRVRVSFGRDDAEMVALRDGSVGSKQSHVSRSEHPCPVQESIKIEAASSTPLTLLPVTTIVCSLL
jgi:hypothetical protein